MQEQSDRERPVELPRYKRTSAAHYPSANGRQHQPSARPACPVCLVECARFLAKFNVRDARGGQRCPCALRRSAREPTWRVAPRTFALVGGRQRGREHDCSGECVSFFEPRDMVPRVAGRRVSGERLPRRRARGCMGGATRLP
eukprot:365776-Chlamydomonas_euryale.AAC.6